MDCKDNSHSGGGVSGGVAARLENFWYHYKWHTIAAVFALFVIIVCTVQCATGTKYDIQVLYAGEHMFGRTSPDGTYPEYMNMVSTLTDFAEDYDGNGETNVTFLDVCPAKNYDDLTILENNMNMSDYYICLLSEELFLQYSTVDGNKNLGRFRRISDYTAKGKDYDYVSEYGIRLSSLDIKDLPGFAGLDDEDTVLCIRNVSAMSTISTKKTSEEQFANSEDMLRALLAYEKKQ